MTRLAWATDIHLDWLDEEWRLREFFDSIRSASPDALLITGDVADGNHTEASLQRLQRELELPIYFVLGNHDFYGRSVREGRRRIVELVSAFPRLVYLPLAGVVELAPDTALVGHDGWGDARLGRFGTTGVFLTDFVLIKELAEVQHERGLLVDRLRVLGDEAAAHFAAVLPEALARYRRVVVATHVPPFREAAWYDGCYSDDDWLPYFACKAVGDVLRNVMEARPEREMLVLCGHTHGGGESRILNNLRVLTGEARYGHPRVQQVLQFGGGDPA